MFSKLFFCFILLAVTTTFGDFQQASYGNQGRTRDRYYVEFNSSAALSRLSEIAAVRQAALNLQQTAYPPRIQLSNGDEIYYPNYIGQFHKTLPHNSFGEVEPAVYQTLVDAIHNNDFNTLANLPGNGKLVNPLAGNACPIVGSDPSSFQIATPSSWASSSTSAEMVELYWWSLLRDVPYANWTTNPLVQQAASSLSQMAGYSGPRSSQGNVTSAELFRNNFPGVKTGPWIPQVFLTKFSYDSIPIDPKMITSKPQYDYLTNVRSWLDCQNGFPNGTSPPADVLDPTPVYPRSWRDLGRIVLVDQIFDPSFRAAIILLNMNIAPTLGPYTTSRRMVGFGTFGPGHILAHLGHAGRVIREGWFQKWNIYRFLRPEAYGGLVHFAKTGQRSYPLPSDVLQNPVLDLIYAYNAQQNLRLPTTDPEYGVGTYLLPQQTGVGSPAHPSYPGGHGVIVGAGVTILKAWFGYVCDQPWPSPVYPSADGQTLLPYTEGNLTICGELNKLAYAVTYARSAIGVHWRLDQDQGLYLGEASAIRMIQEEMDSGTLPEQFPQGFRLEKFDGTVIFITKQTTSTTTTTSR